MKRKNLQRLLLLMVVISTFGCERFEDSLNAGSSTDTSTNESQQQTTSIYGVVNGYRIVDTNQSLCYDSMTGVTVACTGTGYDADYSGNQPSYTTSTSGQSVTDNVTGLVWTQSADTNSDSVINVSDKMSQSSAATYCSNLSTDGYVWRLPSIKELYSLILFSGEDPSSYTGTDTTGLKLFIDSSFERAFGDQDAGERIIDGQYATTTIYTSTTMGGNATMFGVNFVDGRIKGYPYSNKDFYVLCVSGNEDYGLNLYSDNNDGTISDQATGLMWQQDDSQSVDYDDALLTCETASTAGYNDWRLPNVKELQSIVDYSRSPDFTSSAAIDPLFNTTSFTNEEGLTDWGYYWSSTTHANSNGYGDNGAYVSFGRALGYYTLGSSSLDMDDVHGAGAQRSNDKVDVSSVAGAGSANIGYGTFYYHGPQGDVLRIDNMVRCVRDL